MPVLHLVSQKHCILKIFVVLNYDMVNILDENYEIMQHLVIIFSMKLYIL